MKLLPYQVTLLDKITSAIYQGKRLYIGFPRRMGRRSLAAAIAPCGCRPAENIECAQLEALSDYAARKCTAYNDAKGTRNEAVKYHEWSLADFRVRLHQQQARSQVVLI